MPTEGEPARSLVFPSLILPISCYNRTLNTDNYNMERGAHRQNISICRCLPPRTCAGGRYSLAPAVGNLLRERSAFLVRKVCIFEALTADSCVSGQYSFAAAPALRSRGHRSTLLQPTFSAR